MKIIAFAENEHRQFYILENDEEVDCSEERIDQLWFNWVCGNALKSQTPVNGYTYFYFNDPVDVNEKLPSSTKPTTR